MDIYHKVDRFYESKELTKIKSKLFRFSINGLKSIKIMPRKFIELIKKQLLSLMYIIIYSAIKKSS